MKFFSTLALSVLLSLSTSTTIITYTEPSLTATASAFPSDTDTSTPISSTPYTYPPSTLYPTTSTSTSLKTTTRSTTRSTTRTTTRSTTTPIRSTNTTTTKQTTTTPPVQLPFCYAPVDHCKCSPGANGTFCGGNGPLEGDCDPHSIYTCNLSAHDDPKQKAWAVGGKYCKDNACWGECQSANPPDGNAACNGTVPPTTGNWR